MARLSVVATPIGNLQDITLRALEILKAADSIVCEDTRVTAKLLAHFDIKRPLIAYHQHSDPAVAARIVKLLQEGKELALVSDAGTPGINDPGGKLIAELLKNGLQVVAIPGANAGVAALSVSGFPADRYAYWGFVPTKKGRKTFFEQLAQADDAVVFYESKHRILKTLASLADVAPQRPLLVARELTKKFETLYRGTATEVLNALKSDETLGEFVVVAAPKNWH
jgi:16S rRNA (cytidine1402-2'-O)-methyltransferase